MRRWMTGALALISVTGAVALLPPSAQIPVAEAVIEDPPNIIVILTDDQPMGLMDKMPMTQSRIFDAGTRFTNAVIPTTQCCPSRAGLLSGRLAHTTGVYYNDASVNIDGTQTTVGGFAAFNAWSIQPNSGLTLPERLDGAGYRTALVGKYLNGWSGSDGVPEGWDDFIAFDHSSYYNYDLQGTVNESHGDAAADYSTTVLTDHAIDVIDDTPTDQPFFLYFAPSGPHAPYLPAPADEAAVVAQADELTSQPSYNAEITNKPSFMQDFSALSSGQREEARSTYNAQHRVVMSIDRSVNQLMDKLDARQQLSNTMFVFASDHGLALGRHQWMLKYNPYPHTTDVDMAIRWDDGGYTNRNVSKIFTIQDLSATIAAGVGAPLLNADGDPWTVGEPTTASTPYGGTVLEAIRHNLSDREIGGDLINDYHPAYCGFRSTDFLYVRYDGGDDEELYDLTVDPYAIHNKVNNSSYHDHLVKMRDKAKAACSPRPPGFNWS